LSQERSCSQLKTLNLIYGVEVKLMTIEIKIPDMACGDCVETITKAVVAIDPQAQVAANTNTKQVTVETEASESSVKEAIVAAGYNPS
jgi:copper chaperone